MAANFNWTSFHEQNKSSLRFVAFFLRHPVSAIQNVPDFRWPTLIFVHVILTLTGGLLSGLLSGSWIGIISGLFIFPLTSIISLLILSALFFHGFQIFLKRVLSFRKIFWILALAHIPVTISVIFAPWIPLAALIGTSASALLLIIGLSDNFALPRKAVIQFIAALYLVYLVLWIANSLTTTESKKQFQQKATPESLDILEQELKDNS